MDENTDVRNSQHALSPCQELREMLPAYVIGALNADEMARIQALFEACPEAKGELKDYAAVAVGFLDRVDPVSPPAALLGDILDAIRDEPAPPEAPVASKGDAKK